MIDRPHRFRGSQHDKQLRGAPSALARAFVPMTGYGVTVSSMLRPVVTEQYPFEPPQVMPRYYGHHQLSCYDDGLEKCIGCELCAWARLANAICAEAASNEPGAQYSPGEHYGRVYQTNYLRCTFCGICVGTCPARALTTFTDFDELVGPDREDLICRREDLLAPVPEGVVFTPYLMVEGTEDGDYYRGKITGSTQTQTDWVRNHRFEDPSLEFARAKVTSATSGRNSRHTVKGALR